MFPTSVRVPYFISKRSAIFSGSNAFSSSSEFRSSYERTAAVPTHFAKVLIASRAPRHPSLALAPSKQTGSAVTTSFADGKEWVQGAFVLPNEAIPDETKLESFVVPGAFSSVFRT